MYFILNLVVDLFVLISDAALDATGKILVDKENATTNDCEKKCLADRECLSFEISTKTGKCYLLKNLPYPPMKLLPTKNRNFHQRVKCNYLLHLITGFFFPLFLKFMIPFILNHYHHHHGTSFFLSFGILDALPNANSSIWGWSMPWLIELESIEGLGDNRVAIIQWTRLKCKR